MYRSKNFIILTFLLFTLLFFLSVPAFAVWHNEVEEDFNKDQANPNHRWPWLTNLQEGDGWHWNPRDPHPRAEGDARSNYCWGLQDYIFNRRVTPGDEITQAIWCAFTNLSDVNNPRWPEDEDYMNSQNAWVWWGVADLSEAVAAGVSFWMYLDLNHFAGDSLSVFASNVDPADLTDEDFFENVAVGRTYPTQINEDWSHQTFWLDSLTRAGERVSMLGEEEVWIGFVWHSNGADIAGKGAFIDDVSFSWDDGLFDIRPVEAFFGYPVNEDSVQWSDRIPNWQEETVFRLDYKVDGVGETPEFTINLLLDEEVIYSEDLTREGDPDSVHTIVADVVWEATPFEHTLRWELDTPVDENGSVEESNEQNNVLELTFDVIYNPAPEFEILTPADDPTPMSDGPDFPIDFFVDDTLEDDSFLISFYWTEDTTGMAENPEIIWDEYGYVGRVVNAERGESTFLWEPDAYRRELENETMFWVVGIASDGFVDNNTVAVSPGRAEYALDVSDSEMLNPVNFGLKKAFPNPFNDAISLSYNVDRDQSIQLSVYDLAGRVISTLQNGMKTTGKHNLTWYPDNLNGGVYLLQLKGESQKDYMKVIYLP